ncbi:MAG: ROK family transcriptional regulator [Paracoccaceae bacterium]
MADTGRDRQLQKSPNRGSNQIAVRSYNERLILQLVRRHGNLTKPEASRATGLSANAVSVIFRALEDEDLLIREAPLRGQIGQPSTPMRLNPDARHYFGLKIGRRSADLVLINFVGVVLSSISIAYPYPMPDDILEFVKTGTRQLLKDTRMTRKRVFGFGIAMPFEFWKWTDETDMPRDAMDEWRTVDFPALISQIVPWQVEVANDATAACGAELTFSMSDETQDSIYIFVGTLVGGGVVLNGSVFFGRSGNAGGFGPLRVPFGPEGANRLIDHASLFVLERMLREAGCEAADLLADPGLWSAHADIVDRWLDRAALAIAYAIASSLSVIDFEAVVIDGSFPEDVRSALVSKVTSAFFAMDLRGLPIPSISAGRWGAIARAVGAAALPLNESYSINQNTLLRH